MMELIGLFIKQQNSSLPSNYVLSIAIESNGNKWIGTISGLVKI